MPIRSSSCSPRGEDWKINSASPSADGSMIRSVPQNAIGALSNDLLLEIFLLNADMEQDISKQDTWIDGQYRFGNSRAINTTRLSSQVDHAWRELILGSSSLWGRLIDLNYFCSHGVRREWRDEILARSGISALWIRGVVTGFDKENSRFLVSLLDRHWARIERLYIEIEDAFLFPANTWDIFRRPSNTIQNFHFNLETALPFISTGDDPRFLFSDHAPRLRDFQCSSVVLNLRAPWLSNRMRRLDLLTPSGVNSTTIAEWLDVLREMPLLEYLSLSHAFSEDDRTTSQRALQLANLEEISLIDRILQASIFLQHLTPQAGCCPRLEWRTPDVGTLPTPMELGLASQAMSKYAQGWFNNHVVRGLDLSILFNSFKVQEHPYPARPLPFFSMSVSWEQVLVVTLLNSFSLCDFGKITTLKFFSTLFSDQRLESDVRSFFMLLSAVDTLISHSEGFKDILSLRDFVATSKEEYLSQLSHPIFPKLRTIKLQRTIDVLGLEEFFIWRNQIDCPIQILDLTECEDLVEVNVSEESSGFKVIWNHFREGARDSEYMFQQEEFSGLKVIWKDQEGSRESICGTGGPDDG